MNTLWIWNHFCCVEIIASFVSTFGVTVGLIGLLVAIYQYRKSNEIKRAEFCTKIFEAFFKELTYSKIRELLDPDGGFTSEYDKKLNEKFKDSNNVDDQILLTNYLNFF